MVGSGSAPQLAGSAGPGRSSTRTSSTARGVARTTRSPACSTSRTSPTRSSPSTLRTSASAACTSGCVERASAIVGQRDPARRQRGGDPGGLGRPDPAELDPVRQRQDVGREPVAALVGRAPQEVLGDVGSQRVVHGHAASGTASIAPPVGADEDERALDGDTGRVEVGRGHVLQAGEVDPPKLSSVLGRLRDEHGRPRGRGAPGAAHEKHAAVEAEQRFGRGLREPGVGHGVPPPRPVVLDEEPALGPGGRPGEGDARFERELRAAHAGVSTTSERSRSSAGSIPSASANARYSPARRSRSRRGRSVRVARRRTFFGVCSSGTNSRTCTS